LVFLSTAKKDIIYWQKQLATAVEAIKNQQDKTQIQLIETHIRHAHDEAANTAFQLNADDEMPLRVFNFAREFVNIVNHRLQRV
jgi:hypothetical protein